MAANANRDRGCQVCFKEPRVAGVAGFRIGEHCLDLLRAIAKDAGVDVTLDEDKRRPAKSARERVA